MQSAKIAVAPPLENILANIPMRLPAGTGAQQLFALILSGGHMAKSKKQRLKPLRCPFCHRAMNRRYLHLCPGMIKAHEKVMMTLNAWIETRRNP